MGNILMILQAILIVLKVIDYITISWWLVFVPVYLIVGLHALLVIPTLLYVMAKWFRGVINMSRAYSDPISDTAIGRISAEETRLAMVIQIIKLAVKLGGFKLIRRVEVEDVKSQRKYF